MSDFLRERLAKIRSAGGLRQLAGTVTGVDFWSNDYLGLARTQVQGKLKEQGPASGGATGSRSISGDDDAYHAIEQMIAAFHGFPAALVFNSGYTANLGLLSALLRRNDVLLYDELVHASCRDGLRLGLAKTFRFAHNQLEESLLKHLSKVPPDGQLFVLTEARFSMDGDLAPLAEMAELCTKQGAYLIVDEAHSAGVDGPGGRGLVAALGLQERVFASVVTYGKAFGTHGAAVLGSAALREYLVNTCRPFIYTTGPAPAQWRGIAEAYQKLAALHPEQRVRLQQITEHFIAGLAAAGVGALRSAADGPIQVISVPGNVAVMAAEAACREAGLLVKGIRSPTVAAGSERLRICLHAFNTEAEVEQLVGVLSKILPPNSPIAQLAQ